MSVGKLSRDVQEPQDMWNKSILNGYGIVCSGKTFSAREQHPLYTCFLDSPEYRQLTHEGVKSIAIHFTNPSVTRNWTK